MSIAGYLSKVIEDVLAEYFVAPDSQRHDAGPLEWKRLTLKPDVLSRLLDFPVTVKGDIGKLSVAIPWNPLRQDSAIELQVKDVTLVLSLMSTSEWSPEQVAKLENQVRTQEVEKLWEKLDWTDEARVRKQAKDAAAQEGGGMQAFFMKNVLQWLFSRIRLSVRNVHIRFELIPETLSPTVEGLPRPLCPCSIGVTCPTVTYTNPRHISENGESTVTRRELSLTACIYYRPQEQLCYSTGFNDLSLFDPCWRNERPGDGSAASYQVGTDLYVDDYGVRTETRTCLMGGGIPRIVANRRPRASPSPVVIDESNTTRFDSLGGLFTRPSQSLPSGHYTSPEEEIKVYQEYVSSSTEYILPLDTIRMSCRSPDSDVDATVSAEMPIRNMKVNIPLSLFHVTPYLENYARHWARFRDQTCQLAPLMPNICRRPPDRPCKENAREWWRYAVRCIRFCQEASQPVKYWWKSDYVGYLLQARKDYCLLIRAVQVVKIRHLFLRSLYPNLRETLEKALDVYVHDPSIPQSLILFWTRCALGDPDLAESTYYDSNLNWTEPLRRRFAGKSNNPEHKDDANPLFALGMREGYGTVHEALNQFSKPLKERIGSAWRRRLPEEIHTLSTFLANPPPEDPMTEPTAEPGRFRAWADKLRGYKRREGRNKNFRHESGFYQADEDYSIPGIDEYQVTLQPPQTTEIEAGDQNPTPAGGSGYFHNFREKVLSLLRGGGHTINSAGPLWQAGNNMVTTMTERVRSALVDKAPRLLPKRAASGGLDKSLIPKEVSAFELRQTSESDAVLAIEEEVGRIFMKHFRWYFVVDLENVAVNFGTDKLPSEYEKELEGVSPGVSGLFRHGFSSSDFPSRPFDGISSFRPSLFSLNVRHFCLEAGVAGGRETVMDGSSLTPVSRERTDGLSSMPAQSGLHRRVMMFSDELPPSTAQNAEKPTHAKEMRTDLILGITIGSVEIVCGRPKASLPQAVCFWSHSSSRNDSTHRDPFVTAYYYESGGFHVNIGQCTVRISEAALLALGALCEARDNATAFWNSYARSYMAFPVSLSLPAPSFPHLPPKDWTIAGDRFVVETLNRRIFRDLTEAMGTLGIPPSLHGVDNSMLMRGSLREKRTTPLKALLRTLGLSQFYTDNDDLQQSLHDLESDEGEIERRKLEIEQALSICMEPLLKPKTVNIRISSQSVRIIFSPLGSGRSTEPNASTSTTSESPAESALDALGEHDPLPIFAEASNPYSEVDGLEEPEPRLSGTAWQVNESPMPVTRDDVSAASGDSTSSTFTGPVDRELLSDSSISSMQIVAEFQTINLNLELPTSITGRTKIGLSVQKGSISAVPEHELSIATASDISTEAENKPSDLVASSEVATPVEPEILSSNSKSEAATDSAVESSLNLGDDHGEVSVVTTSSQAKVVMSFEGAAISLELDPFEGSLDPASSHIIDKSFGFKLAEFDLSVDVSLLPSFKDVYLTGTLLPLLAGFDRQAVLSAIVTNPNATKAIEMPAEDEGTLFEMLSPGLTSKSRHGVGVSPTEFVSRTSGSPSSVTESLGGLNVRRGSFDMTPRSRPINADRSEKDLNELTDMGTESLPEHVQRLLLLGKVGRSLGLSSLSAGPGAYSVQGLLKLQEIKALSLPAGRAITHPTVQSDEHLDTLVFASCTSVNIEDWGQKVLLSLYSNLDEIVPRALVLVDGVFSYDEDNLSLKPVLRGASVDPGTQRFIVHTSHHAWKIGPDYVTLEAAMKRRVRVRTKQKLQLVFQEVGWPCAGAVEWCLSLAGNQSGPHVSEPPEKLTPKTHPVPDALRATHVDIELTRGNVQMTAGPDRATLRIGRLKTVLSCGIRRRPPIWSKRHVATWPRDATALSYPPLPRLSICLASASVDVETMSGERSTDGDILKDTTGKPSVTLFSRDDMSLTMTQEADKRLRQDFNASKKKNYTTVPQQVSHETQSEGPGIKPPTLPPFTPLERHGLLSSLPSRHLGRTLLLLESDLLSETTIKVHPIMINISPNRLQSLSRMGANFGQTAMNLLDQVMELQSLSLSARIVQPAVAARKADVTVVQQGFLPHLMRLKTACAVSSIRLRLLQTRTEAELALVCIGGLEISGVWCSIAALNLASLRIHGPQGSLIFQAPAVDPFSEDKRKENAQNAKKRSAVQRLEAHWMIPPSRLKEVDIVELSTLHKHQRLGPFGFDAPEPPKVPSCDTSVDELLAIQSQLCKQEAGSAGLHPWLNIEFQRDTPLLRQAQTLITERLGNREPKIELRFVMGRMQGSQFNVRFAEIQLLKDWITDVLSSFGAANQSVDYEETPQTGVSPVVALDELTVSPRVLTTSGESSRGGEIATVRTPGANRRQQTLYGMAARLASYRKVVATVPEEACHSSRICWLPCLKLSCPTCAILDPEPLLPAPLEMHLGDIRMNTSIGLSVAMPPNEILDMSSQLLDPTSRTDNCVVLRCKGSFAGGRVHLSRGRRSSTHAENDGHRILANGTFWSNLSMPSSRVPEGLRYRGFKSDASGGSTATDGPLSARQPKRFILFTGTIPQMDVHPSLWRAFKRNLNAKVPGIARVVPLRRPEAHSLSSLMQEAPLIRPRELAVAEQAGSTGFATRMSRSMLLVSSKNGQMNSRKAASQSNKTFYRLSRDRVSPFVALPLLEWESLDAVREKQYIYVAAQVDGFSMVLRDNTEAPIMSLAAEQFVFTYSGTKHSAHGSIRSLEIVEFVSQPSRLPCKILKFGPRVDACSVSLAGKEPPVICLTETRGLEYTDVPQTPDIAFQSEPFSITETEQLDTRLALKDHGSRAVVVHELMTEPAFELSNRSDQSDRPLMRTSMQIKDPIVTLRPSFLGLCVLLLSEHVAKDLLQRRGGLGNITPTGSGRKANLIESKMLSMVAGVGAQTSNHMIEGATEVYWPTGTIVQAARDQLAFAETAEENEKGSIFTDTVTALDLQSVATGDQVSAVGLLRRGDRSSSSQFESEFRPLRTRVDHDSDRPQDAEDRRLWESLDTGYLPEGWRRAQKKTQFLRSWQNQSQTLRRSLLSKSWNFRRGGASKSTPVDGRSPTPFMELDRRKLESPQLGGIWTSRDDFDENGSQDENWGEEYISFETIGHLANTISLLNAWELVALLHGCHLHINPRSNYSESPWKLDFAGYLKHFELKIEGIQCSIILPGRFCCEQIDAGDTTADTVFHISAGLGIETINRGLNLIKYGSQSHEMQAATMQTALHMGSIITLKVEALAMDSWLATMRHTKHFRHILEETSANFCIRKLHPVPSALALQTHGKEVVRTRLANPLVLPSHSREKVAPIHIGSTHTLPEWQAVWSTLLTVTGNIAPLKIALSACDLCAVTALLAWLDAPDTSGKANVVPTLDLFSPSSSPQAEKMDQQGTALFSHLLQQEGEPLLYSYDQPYSLTSGVLPAFFKHTAGIRIKDLESACLVQGDTLIVPQSSGDEKCASGATPRMPPILIGSVAPVKMELVYSLPTTREAGDHALLRCGVEIKTLVFDSPTVAMFSWRREAEIRKATMITDQSIASCVVFDVMVRRPEVVDWESLVDPWQLKLDASMDLKRMSLSCVGERALSLTLGVSHFRALYDAYSAIDLSAVRVNVAVKRRRTQFWRRALRGGMSLFELSGPVDDLASRSSDDLETPFGLGTPSDAAQMPYINALSNLALDISCAQSPTSVVLVNDLVRERSHTLLLRNRTGSYLVCEMLKGRVGLLAPQSCVPVPIPEGSGKCNLYWFSEDPKLRNEDRVAELAPTRSSFCGYVSGIDLDELAHHVLLGMQPRRDGTGPDVVVTSTNVEICSDGRTSRLRPREDTPFRLIDFSSALQVENYSPMPVKIRVSNQTEGMVIPWFEATLSRHRGVPANCTSVPFSNATWAGAVLQATIDTRTYLAGRIEVPHVLLPPASGAIDEMDIPRLRQPQPEILQSQAIPIDWPSDLHREVNMLQYHFLRFESKDSTHYLTAVRQTRMVTARREQSGKGGTSRALLSKLALCAGATVENQLPMVLSIALRNQTSTKPPVRATINPGRRTGITTILPTDSLELAVSVSTEGLVTAPFHLIWGASGDLFERWTRATKLPAKDKLKKGPDIRKHKGLGRSCRVVVTLFDINGSADTVKSQIRVTTTFDPCFTDDVLTSSQTEIRAPLRIVFSASFVIINRVRELPLGLALQAEKEPLINKMIRLCGQAPSLREWQGVVRLAASKLTDCEADNEPFVSTTLDEAWSDIRLGLLGSGARHDGETLGRDMVDASPLCGLRVPCLAPPASAQRARSTSLAHETTPPIALRPEATIAGSRHSQSKSVFTAWRDPVPEEIEPRDSLRRGRLYSLGVGHSQGSIASLLSGSDQRRGSALEASMHGRGGAIDPTHLGGSEDERELTNWEKICCMITSLPSPSKTRPLQNLEVGEGGLELSPVSAAVETPTYTAILPNPKPFTRHHLAALARGHAIYWLDSESGFPFVMVKTAETAESSPWKIQALEQALRHTIERSMMHEKEEEEADLRGTHDDSGRARSLQGRRKTLARWIRNHRPRADSLSGLCNRESVLPDETVPEVRSGQFIRHIRPIGQTRQIFRLRSQFTVDVTADLRELPDSRTDWPLYPVDHLRPNTSLVEILPSVIMMNLTGGRLQVRLGHKMEPICLASLSLCPLSAPPDTIIPSYRLRDSDMPRASSAIAWTLSLRLGFGKRPERRGWTDVWTPPTQWINVDELLVQATEGRGGSPHLYPFVTREGETLAAISLSTQKNQTTGQILLIAQDCTTSPFIVLNGLRSAGAILIPQEEPFLEPPGVKSRLIEQNVTAAPSNQVENTDTTPPSPTTGPPEAEEANPVKPMSPVAVQDRSQIPPCFHYFPPNAAGPFFPPPHSRCSSTPSELVAELLFVPPLSSRTHTGLKETRPMKPTQALASQPRYRIRCEWPKLQDWLPSNKSLERSALYQDRIYAIIPNSGVRSLQMAIVTAIKLCARQATTQSISDLLSSVFVRTGESWTALRRDEPLPLKSSVWKRAISTFHRRSGDSALIYLAATWRGTSRVLIIGRNPPKVSGQIFYLLSASGWATLRESILTRLQAVPLRLHVLPSRFNILQKSKPTEEAEEVLVRESMTDFLNQTFPAIRLADRRSIRRGGKDELQIHPLAASRMHLSVRLAELGVSVVAGAQELFLLRIRMIQADLDRAVPLSVNDLKSEAKILLKGCSYVDEISRVLGALVNSVHYTSLITQASFSFSSGGLSLARYEAGLSVDSIRLDTGSSRGLLPILGSVTDERKAYNLQAVLYTHRENFVTPWGTPVADFSREDQLIQRADCKVGPMLVSIPLAILLDHVRSLARMFPPTFHQRLLSPPARLRWKALRPWTVRSQDGISLEKEAPLMIQCLDFSPLDLSISATAIGLEAELREFASAFQKELSRDGMTQPVIDTTLSVLLHTYLPLSLALAAATVADAPVRISQCTIQDLVPLSEAANRLLTAFIPSATIQVAKHVARGCVGLPKKPPFSRPQVATTICRIPTPDFSTTKLLLAFCANDKDSALKVLAQSSLVKGADDILTRSERFKVFELSMRPDPSKPAMYENQLSIKEVLPRFILEESYPLTPRRAFESVASLYTAWLNGKGILKGRLFAACLGCGPSHGRFWMSLSSGLVLACIKEYRADGELSGTSILKRVQSPGSATETIERPTGLQERTIASLNAATAWKSVSASDMRCLSDGCEISCRLEDSNVAFTAWDKLENVTVTTEYPETSSPSTRRTRARITVCIPVDSGQAHNVQHLVCSVRDGERFAALYRSMLRSNFKPPYR